MIIRVVKRDHPYVMIDKTALEDPRLSFRAKGLHAYLLTKPDNWIPNREQLATVSKEGRDAVEVALRELKACGYFERKRERCADGTFQFVGIVYEVCQSTTDGKSGSREPVPGYPATENPPVISKEVKNKENKEPTSDKPRRETVKKKDLDHLTEGYAVRKGVRPQGDEWKPIQQGYRRMLLDGNTVEQIEGCEDAIVEQGWTWTINTVRRWMPDFRAGKFPSKDGRDADRIRALRDDIGEIDRYVKSQLDPRLIELERRDVDVGDLTVEQCEEVARLHQLRQAKMVERARLVRELGK